MEGHIRASSKTTSDSAMVYSSGKMAGLTEEIGLMESKMASGFSKQQIQLKNKRASGVMESD